MGMPRHGDAAQQHHEQGDDPGEDRPVDEKLRHSQLLAAGVRGGRCDVRRCRSARPPVAAALLASWPRARSVAATFVPGCALWMPATMIRSPAARPRQTIQSIPEAPSVCTRFIDDRAVGPTVRTYGALRIALQRGLRHEEGMARDSDREGQVDVHAREEGVAGVGKDAAQSGGAGARIDGGGTEVELARECRKVCRPVA